MANMEFGVAYVDSHWGHETSWWVNSKLDVKNFRPAAEPVRPEERTDQFRVAVIRRLLPPPSIHQLSFFNFLATLHDILVGCTIQQFSHEKLINEALLTDIRDIPHTRHNFARGCAIPSLVHQTVAPYTVGQGDTV
jgi:hypothetical protein